MLLSAPRNQTLVVSPSVAFFVGFPFTTAISPGNDGLVNWNVNVLPPAPGLEESSPLPSTVNPSGTVMFIVAVNRSAVYPFTGNQRAGYSRNAKSFWMAANLIP